MMNFVATSKDAQTPLRLPKEMMDAIDVAARRNGRSRNSEIFIRLAESLGLRDKEEKAA